MWGLGFLPFGSYLLAVFVLFFQAGFDTPTKLACWGTLVSGVDLGLGLNSLPGS